MQPAAQAVGRFTHTANKPRKGRRKLIPNLLIRRPDSAWHGVLAGGRGCPIRRGFRRMVATRASTAASPLFPARRPQRSRPTHPASKLNHSGCTLIREFYLRFVLHGAHSSYYRWIARLPHNPTVQRHSDCESGRFSLGVIFPQIIRRIVRLVSQSRNRLPRDVTKTIAPCTGTCQPTEERSQNEERYVRSSASGTTQFFCACP